MSGILSCRFPDCAKFILGRAEGVTRGLHPDYGSHTRIVVTFAPIGCPKISDSVRQFPPEHSRHSPAAPELPNTTSGIGARFGCH
jgi:hypothetical protein